MQIDSGNKLPITVLIAVKNESANMARCLSALSPAQRVVVLDSYSTDETAAIAIGHGAEVLQFDYSGGYPKKRQWALENVPIETPWILLLDADEVVPAALWEEMASAIHDPGAKDAYLITKGFHFLGRRMRHGGFSHSAVLLFKTGRARFERLFDDERDSLDMEIHERVIVDGSIGRLATPLVHEDFKGLEAYIARHNKYSTWEARLRYRFLTTGSYGEETVRPHFFWQYPGTQAGNQGANYSHAVRAPDVVHLSLFLSPWHPGREGGIDRLPDTSLLHCPSKSENF